VSKVTVAIIPIVGITALILFLNIVAPSSADVRVIKYVVQVIPQVKGRVIDVPAEGNRPMKKGDVLFRIDPWAYELDVKALEAQLAESQGSAQELREQLKVAQGNTAALGSQIQLTTLRVKQYQELSRSGAGNRFDLEKAEADLANLQGQVASAIAQEARAQAQLAAVVDGDLASVATIKANLAKARWELTQTVMYAPANGSAINVQLRAGSFVNPVPLAPAMSFVEDEFQVIALYAQNELWRVEPGNEAEIVLSTYPGDIIKAAVESIIWAQGQGQMAQSGILPQTGSAPIPPGRFAVKLKIAEKDKGRFLAAGAMGNAAIYTNHGEMIHIIRKVILRVGSYTNFLILKLH
jgi:multidrug resistance efflux pump